MEKLFQKEANGGKNAGVRAFASKTLPTVRRHRAMARDMMRPATGNTNASNMKMD